MRIRSIKPEFWKSERVASLPRDSRLLFIGLWNLADDAGRFRAHPSLIQGELFPYEPQSDVAGWLQPLVAAGLVLLYEVDGRRFGLVVGFNEHQKIDKRTESRLPPPPQRRAQKPAERPALPAESPEVAPVAAEKSAGSAESSAGSAERSGADWIRDQGSGRGSGRGDGMAPDARVGEREAEGPGSPEPGKPSPEGPAAGHGSRKPPSDAALALQRRLSEAGYRESLKPHDRTKAILARAIDLAAAGMTEEDLVALIALDREKAKTPGALLAVWIDRRQWRDVLAEQRMKAREASGAADRAKAEADLLDGIYGSEPAPAASIVSTAIAGLAPRAEARA